jgi:hypothetical protein
MSGCRTFCRIGIGKRAVFKEKVIYMLVTQKLAGNGVMGVPKGTATKA